jgi:hypothetical protein
MRSNPYARRGKGCGAVRTVGGCGTNLGVDALGGLLDEPLLAVLATLRRDGSVLLSPVWCEWRDGGFNVWAGDEDIYLGEEVAPGCIPAITDPDIVIRLEPGVTRGWGFADER